MSLHRFEVRAAGPEDLDGLYEVARHLNSVNLPANRERLARALALSEASFRGDIDNPREGEFVFVLIDNERKGELSPIVGSSMIFAQLGRRGAPYIYLDVLPEERYSTTMDRHVRHTTLKIGYSYDGPTELGGLALLPEYRHGFDRLGLTISAVRFMYIRAFRSRFQSELLAELMPPLRPDGSSALWDALGHPFTGMGYDEADKLRRDNKEFIRGLFPEAPVHTALLAPEARDVIGRVGPGAIAARDLLTSIGFRYAERIDAFDGGPHYTAPTDSVSYVRESHLIAFHAHERVGRAEQLLVARSMPEAPYFRMLRVDGIVREGGVGYMRGETMREFGMHDGDTAWALALSEIPPSYP